MKKENRIKKSTEFQQVMQRRRFKNSKIFTVYYAPKVEKQSRFGIAVPKKLGNAVFRNKAKRQVRNMLREMNQSIYPFDAVILVRKAYIEATFVECIKDLEKLLKTVKIDENVS